MHEHTADHKVPIRNINWEKLTDLILNFFLTKNSDQTSLRQPIYYIARQVVIYSRIVIDNFLHKIFSYIRSS